MRKRRAASEYRPRREVRRLYPVLVLSGSDLSAARIPPQAKPDSTLTPPPLPL
jgi:hypothetical protein